MFRYYYDVWIIEFLVCFVTAVAILKLNIPMILKFKRSRDIELGYWKWGIIISGIATPWITALAVWIILQIKGLPVISLSYIFSGRFLFVFCISTIVLAMPFFIFSSIARQIFKIDIHIDANMKIFEKKIIVLNGIIGGIITTTYMTYNLWQSFYEAIEAIILGFPYVVSCSLIGIIVGLLGACIAIIADRILGNVQEVRNLKGQK